MQPLEIFPPGGLSTSVITCVWVGVFVVAFFNLRFGWVLTGLVVPGYVVPLLLLKPWSAFAIYIESVSAYALVWFVSERMSRYGLWSRLFGRDRFFMLIIASIGVRLLFDVEIFPGVGAWLTRHHDIELDYENDLHSLGLIVVALIANIFWKPGLGRGSLTLFVTVGLTFLIVRFGLMEFTNFRITDLQYAYEDLSSSILASPKAYIILVSTALIASRMNLFYGWEYNGILMPSLIALQWYQPIKVFSSFFEALLILAIASAVLRLRVFANVNVEGARKLLLFFNIGFAYKLLLGFFLATFYPEFKVSDAFGFGYLLSTLIAIKMHDKGIVGRMMRATLQTSLTALFLATIVGFALTYLPSVQQVFAPTATQTSTPRAPPTDDVDLKTRLRRASVDVYARHGTNGVPAPSAPEITAFEEGLRRVTRVRAKSLPGSLDETVFAFDRARYEVHWVEDRYVYLEPQQAYPGRGIFVFDTRAATDLVVVAPAAADERHTMDAALWLFEHSGARALLIAGTYLQTNANRSMDTLYNGRSYLATAQRAFSRGQVVHVRGVSQLQREPVMRGRAKPQAQRSSLWVTGSLPPGLDLVTLEEQIDEFDIRWQPAPGGNILRDQARRDFAELFLTENARRGVIARLLGHRVASQLEVRSQRIDGYIEDWLLGGKERIARRGTDSYQPPSAPELLFLDEEIFTPLARMAHAGAADQDILGQVAAAADVFNYEVVHYRNRRSGAEYLIARERETAAKLFWGTYVFRMGAADEFIVQVPRPIFEQNSLEYAVALFEILRGRALVIAGAHPFANRTGESDLVRMSNMANPFNLATQVLLRELDEDETAFVLHSRAFGWRLSGAQPRTDAIVAFSDGLRHLRQLPRMGRKLVDVLTDSGLSWQLADGSEATAGYEVGGLPQSLYPSSLANKYFGILWLSPSVRGEFRQAAQDPRIESEFRALGVRSSRADLVELLAADATAASDRGVIDRMRAPLARYIERDDIVSLYNVLRLSADFEFERVIDTSSRQTFLIVRARGGGIVAAANLHPLRDEVEMTASASDIAARALEFVDRRAGWFFVGDSS